MQKSVAYATRKTTPAEILVGANECRLARQGERLIARDVAADVVVTLQAPNAGFNAMLRFSAPNEPNVSRQRLEALWLFADEALSLLFDSLRSMDTPIEEVTVSAIGGADTEEAVAESGKDLAQAIRRILAGHGVVLQGSDLGGSQKRSVWLDSTSGRLIVRSTSTRPSTGCVASCQSLAS